MSKIYVFNYAFQSWVDGMDNDDWPNLESMARSNFSHVVVAEGDKETDEAFWSAVSQLKKKLEREYAEVYGDEEPLRWVDGGWITQEGWATERSFALMAGTEFVGLVTAVVAETGI